MTNLEKAIESCIKCMNICEMNIKNGHNSGNYTFIHHCRDCADVCNLCVRFSARDSVYTKKIMALCVEICNVCSVECHKNEVHHPTSMACAMACLKCAEDCKNYIQEAIKNDVAMVM